ncbi:hypothetical protein HOY82DRAFT_586722 [Tuber indicum]|nr:hypothetical protein HOY82DRAFT_586722 [Tuber indicum]
MDKAESPPTISTSASTKGHRVANQKSGLLLAWGQAEVCEVRLYTGTRLGPSRCDKTLLSKAAAKESRANFISISGPELLGLFVISNHGSR